MRPQRARSLRSPAWNPTLRSGGNGTWSRTSCTKFARFAEPTRGRPKAPRPTQIKAVDGNHC